MSRHMSRVHGGPDALGVPLWDFSTNANACGPCPPLADELRQVDARHYPDPSYQVLRRRLADFHDVEVSRVVLAASASEFIMRLTAYVARQGARHVWMPEMAYGEYVHAAEVWGLSRMGEPGQADLCWLCEPSSPRGAAEWQVGEVVRQDTVIVLDRAYEPLRLSGESSLQGGALDRVWQLWSPNKALGVTGIRGAYAIAPVSGVALAPSLEKHASSWPLGVHGVAMLAAWTTPEVQAWLASSLDTLRIWKAEQLALLKRWRCLPSDANFFCMQAELDPAILRAHGVKLRDTSSFGLPGHWRLSVQPPATQAALLAALEAGDAA
jgi:histidinol-phosphate aminotransferase